MSSIHNTFHGSNVSSTDSSSLSSSRKQVQKLQKKVCDVCQKKIRPFLEEMNRCKCQKVYCNLHIHRGDHGCLFDYLKENQKQLEKKDSKPLHKAHSDKERMSGGSAY